MTTATHVYDPDLGPVIVTALADAEKEAWGGKKAIVVDQWCAYPEDGAPQYHEVFLVQLGSKYRFIGWGGAAYGPVHQHLVAAIYFAFGHGWIDPGCSFDFNVKCMVEVRTNTRKLNDPDFDAWSPMSEGRGANQSRDNDDRPLLQNAPVFTDLASIAREVVA